MIFCLECLQEVAYDIIVEKRTVQVRDEQIVIEEKVPKCKCCGENVFVKEIEDENLSNAFDAYKTKKGLLASKEVKAIREKFGLTQLQFARLLRVGDKSITRYENGAIQEGSIDTLIRLAGTTRGLKQLLEINGNRLTPLEYNDISKRLEEKTTVVLSPIYIQKSSKAKFSELIDNYSSYADCSENCS